MSNLTVILRRDIVQKMANQKNDLSEEIQDFLSQREKFRKTGQFAKADKIREKIIAQGYSFVDQGDQTQVFKTKEKTLPLTQKNFLVIFGSGEIAPSAVKIHEYALKNLNKKEVVISIVSTPAGFQPNVKVVHEEIENFFIKHLQNFHPKVEIIYANTRKQANEPKIISPIEKADYIFVGPGSPTYAVKNLEGTLLYQKIIEKIKKGATLSLASAATIAFSKYVLPVYEIYKAGLPLYWAEGLNLYAQFFRPLTIIPHFNNNEGGRKSDTSSCFMGKERFEKLLKKLPKNEEVWGIDEHTAVLIDITTQEISVLGKGERHRVKLPAI